VHNQRRRGDVQRQVAVPRVGGDLGHGSRPLDVGRFGVAFRLVLVQQSGQW
jgi:hypothetical protein